MDRALALGLAEFVAVLVVAAVLYILMDPAAGELVATGLAQTSDTGATDHINLLDQIWGLLLAFAIFLAALFLIARAVFESRRPG